MYIHKILADSGEWIQGEDNIAREACEYYKSIFTGKTERVREDMLHCILNIVTPEQNVELERIPTLEELRRVVMHMNTNSAPGPDGIGGKFYQIFFLNH